jgi:t-SNARE complex subunit (syntaxin)
MLQKKIYIFQNGRTDTMTLIFDSIPLEIYETINNNTLCYNIRSDEYTHNENDPSVLSEELITIKFKNQMINIRRTASNTSSRTSNYENTSLQSIPYNGIDNIILDLTLKANNNYKSSPVRFLFLQNGKVIHELQFSIQLLHIPKEDLPKLEKAIQYIHENLVREVLTTVPSVM